MHKFVFHAMGSRAALHFGICATLMIALFSCSRGAKVSVENRGALNGSAACDPKSSDCEVNRKGSPSSNTHGTSYNITGPGKISNANTITIAWDDFGAASYVVIFSKEPTCKVSVYTFTNVTRNLQIADGIDEGHYYICVMAQQGDQLVAAKNNGYEIYIDRTPPGEFQFLAPINTTNSQTPVISWSTSTGASTYDLLIAHDADCKSIVQSHPEVTTTSVTTDLLADHQSYYACVTAQDLAGNKTQIKTSFQLDTSGLTPFSITAPASLTNDAMPTVTWSASLNATSYTLSIGTAAGCSTPLQSYGNLTAVSKALSPLSDGSYFLCLSAISAQGSTIVADNTNYPFTIDTAAPTVSITSTAGSLTNTSPIPVTITFSKTITGFAIGDVNVGNGTTGTLGGSGFVYTLDVTPSGQGAVTIDIAASVVTDLAGNANASATQLSVTYDSVAPTAPMLSGTTPTNNTTPTWSWSAGSGGNGTFRYKLDDSTMTSGATTTTNATFTPSSALAAGAHTLYVQERDAAGNWSSPAGYSINIDTTAPTVSITSTETSPSNAASFPITITFSETVSNFVVGDVTVSNGTKANFGGSGSIYTVDVIPTGQGAVTVDVAGSVANDAAGNNNSAATQLSITYDSVGPAAPSVNGTTPTTNTTPTWSWSSGGGGNGTYRFKLDDNDLTSGATTTTNTSFTPGSALTSEAHTLYIQERDTAGNWSAPVQKLITVDTTPPSASITTTASSLTNLASIPITVIFSESVSGFTASGISVSGGTKSGFSGSGSTYTLNIAPTADGLITIDIAAAVAQDAAGNNNTAATQLSLVSDRTAPAAGSPSTLSFSNVTSSSVTVTWNKATDNLDAQSDINYILYYSTSNDISTLTNIATNWNGTPAGSARNDISTWTVSGLFAGTTYYFNVVARDQADNRAVYTSASQAMNNFTSGAGTFGNPYIISNVYELQNVGNNLSAYFQVANDIDASATYKWNSGTGFTPIGTSSNKFAGNFDGNGKLIRNLFIQRTTTNDVGLFGYIGTSGVVTKVGLKNVTIAGQNTTGALAGTNEGSVSQSYALGYVAGVASIAGLVGKNNGGTVSDCYYTGVVYSSGGNNVGGLVGYNTGTATLQNSYAKSNVSQSGAYSNSAGLVGFNENSSISNTFAVGRVAGGSGGNSGGLVGNNSATSSVTGSYYFQTGINGSSCVGTDSSAAAVCTAKTTASWFTTTANAPISNWNFASNGNWILPQTGKYPVLRWESPNAAISFGLEIINGRKIASSDKAAYKLWGFCSSPGDSVDLTATDVINGTVNASTSCAGGRWEFTTLNFSSLAQGDITVSVVQNIGGSLSSSVTRTLKLDSVFCDGNPVSGSFAGGTGTVGDPYTICTVAQLNAIGGWSMGGYNYKLKNNLDLNSGVFATSTGMVLTGTLDGDNYVLKNQTVALLASINGGSVKNLGLEDVAISSSVYASALSSYIYTASGSVVSDMHVSGTVLGSGSTFAASLFSGNSSPNSTLTNLFSTATVVTGANGYAYGVSGGGVTGTNSFFAGDVFSAGMAVGVFGGITNATNVYMTGDILGATYSYGVIGSSGTSASLTNLYNTGNIFGGSYQGGVIGTMSSGSTMTGAYSTGYLVGYAVGGIATTLGGTLSNSYSTAVIAGGTVAGIGYNVGSATTVTGNYYSGVMSGVYGGLVGEVINYPLTLQNSYINASMVSSVANAGGMVGKITSAGASSTVIEKSYVNGSLIDIGTPNVGGIVGYIANAAPVIRDSYYNGDLMITGGGWVSYLGGLVGYIDTGCSGLTISRSYVVSAMTHSSSYTRSGGLIGYNISNITLTNSFATPVQMRFTSGSGPSYVITGMVVGVNGSTIAANSNVYKASPVTGTYSACAGADTNSTMQSCSSTNNVAYFYTHTNVPMNNWDFSTVWKDPVTTGFPILNWQ